MCEGEETGDVFFRGVLLYKPGALATCQKCRAELKFESKSGFKRLELYHIHGNRRMPGSPWMTIPLTNALGVTSGKHHTITRAKYTFLVVTPRERYQLSTLTEEEKSQWMIHLDRILNHFPVDNRTFEFHVNISPTNHSDKLQLTGQYILKVSETELHLYSASGTIHSKFWTPLGCVRSATHCLLPASSWPPHKHLLIIYTEGSSPNGEGGFAFFTDSAKDIAATITHRKEMRIQARSAAALPPPIDEDDATKSSPRHQRLQNIMSDPVSPSAEIDLDFMPGSVPEREARLKDRGEQSSLRKCARKSRVIPISHQLEKAKSQLKLQLGEDGAEQQKEKRGTPLFTPDEPTHIATDKLANYQEKFREWKRVRGQRETRSRTSPGVLSPESGSQQKLCSPVDRRSTISTPTSDRPTSDMSSLDGDYVTINRQSHGEEEESGESETSLGRLQGLQRQTKIDIHSPHDILQDPPQFIQTRPRTNAISYGSPPLSSSPDRLLWSPDRVQTNRTLAGKEFRCDENTCWLQTRAPPLSTTQQKSGSDPQLSTRVNDDLLASAEYLKVVPPNPPSKKIPKKPKPTPRTRKPANLPLPQRTSVFTMTPPTPTLPGGQVRNSPSPIRSLNRGLDVRTLLSSQRSLSESNLFSNLSNDSEDDYVDMSHYQKQWEQRQLYVNFNELHPVVPREMSLQRRAMRRQASSSCGDLPAAATVDVPQPLYENAKCCTVLFGETEVAYENGRHAMEHFMYGQAGEGNDSVDPGTSSKSSRGNVTGPCSYGDSGLGSTPSGSPLLTCQQRSFSLDDVRQVAGAQLTDEDQLEMTEEFKPERPPKPCKWQFPCCVKVIRGQLGHVTHQNSYENLPLILSS